MIKTKEVYLPKILGGVAQFHFATPPFVILNTSKPQSQILADIGIDYHFVLETVNLLMHNHGISLSSETILPSGQGCFYTSISFRKLLKDKELRQSPLLMQEKSILL
ncbi:MAG TPA: hypothetical protein VIK78_21750 [Ruminiclostridium sp.]